MQQIDYKIIKSCPFCGGKGILARRGISIIDGEKKTNCYVFCDKCSGRGSRIINEDYHSLHDAQMAAISAWNQRVV